MIEQLCEKKARDFAREIFLNSGEISNQFHYVHTKNVVNIIGLISKKFKLDIDKMQAIAWVHDIGYIVENTKDHAKDSINLLEKEKIKLDEVDKDCILNHGSDKTPQTKEGKIMQIADKLSVFDSDLIEILLKQKEITEEDIHMFNQLTLKGISQLRILKKELEKLN